MLWLDEKYMRLLSPTLEQYHERGSHVFNFRCTLCGDSERNKRKARAYVFPLHDKLMFKCHNCSVSLPFSAYLKATSRRLFDDYIFEKLSDAAPVVAPVVPVQVDKPLHNATYAPVHSVLDAKDIPALEPVYAFLAKRRVPERGMSRLFATCHARTWLTPLVDDEGKIKELKDGVPWLIQPLTFGRASEWYGAQIRRLDKKEFYTFRWSKDPLKLFGLDGYNPALPGYVVEGPIDSVFLPNAIASCGADLVSSVQIAKDMHVIPEDAPLTYVWDNEPRNSEVKKHMRSAIRLKEPVMIWATGYPKDVNDCILQGIEPDALIAMFESRVFTGLRAELEMSAWEKT